ncbi:unnamed protein product [Amoebophrya sp. A120]|nr:unnamed protein product [Amoebophrya sp. A120]|eukprot:GSA120T00005883001.1
MAQLHRKKTLMSSKKNSCYTGTTGGGQPAAALLTRVVALVPILSSGLGCSWWSTTSTGGPQVASGGLIGVDAVHLSRRGPASRAEQQGAAGAKKGTSSTVSVFQRNHLLHEKENEVDYDLSYQDWQEVLTHDNKDEIFSFLDRYYKHANKEFKVEIGSSTVDGVPEDSSELIQILKFLHEDKEVVSTFGTRSHPTIMAQQQADVEANKKHQRTSSDGTTNSSTWPPYNRKYKGEILAKLTGGDWSRAELTDTIFKAFLARGADVTAWKILKDLLTMKGGWTINYDGSYAIFLAGREESLLASSSGGSFVLVAAAGAARPGTSCTTSVEIAGRVDQHLLLPAAQSFLAPGGETLQAVSLLAPLREAKQDAAVALLKRFLKVREGIRLIEWNQTNRIRLNVESN